jgi:transposase
MLRPGSVSSPEIVLFLKHLRRHIGTHVILIWDGLHAHRSLETRKYIDQQRWLTVERLPGYAPELNPVEGMWSWFKGSVVPNYCPHELWPLGTELRKGRRRLARRKGLSRSFLHKAGLSL